MCVKVFLLTLAFAAFMGAGYSSKSAVLDERVERALRSFSRRMSTGWPEIGIPALDPIDLAFQNGHHLLDDLLTNGQVTSLIARGVSGMSINAVESNVLFLKAKAQMTVPVLEITGSRYTPGTFSSEIRNLLINIGIKFTVSEEDRSIEVDDVEVSFGISHDEDYFENNDLKSAMESETVLLDILRATYQSHFQIALRYEMNLALEGNGENDDLEDNDPIDDFFDRLFADIRQLIIQDHLDPMHLPEDSDDFSVDLFNTIVNGTVTINKGALGGLSTLHRAGNMSVGVKPLRTEVIWDGEVGFDDLEVDYTFGLDFPIFGKDISLSLKMSYVHLSFETDVFIVRENITLAACNITELGPIHFKEKGAGPLDTTLYDLLMNTFLGALHSYVMKAGEEVVCELLRTALSHV